MLAHLFSTLTRGGAATAALRLHRGLINTGIQSVFVNPNETLGERNFRMAHYETPTFLDRSLRYFQRRLFRFYDIPLRGISGAECPSRSRVPSFRYLPKDLFNCDIINLHWVANFIDVPSLLQTATITAPVVWTLHDMRPMTGACHYDGNCGKFKSSRGCSECPQLVDSGILDGATTGFSYMNHGLKNIPAERLSLVTPSRWLAHEAKQSKLLGRFDIQVIPYGLDTGIFTPANSQAVRAEFGIADDAPVVLFVSDDVSNKRKGIGELLSALKSVNARNRELTVLVVGRGRCPEFSGRCIHLGPIWDESRLAKVYSCASLFVCPSNQDNLPNTLLESIACGTPVVGFGVGGVPEVAREGETGWIANEITTEALASAIERGLSCLAQSENVIRRRCREVAVTEFGLATQAQAYLRLFEKLIG